jgi:hypothetical protein
MKLLSFSHLFRLNRMIIEEPLFLDFFYSILDSTDPLIYFVVSGMSP